MLLNKSTKIWLNYLLGAVISLLLLWGIYLQSRTQLGRIDKIVWSEIGPMYYLYICLLLLPVNALLEAKKWQWLAGSAQPLSYGKAFSSYLAGIAISIVTPNRIGEYPGRILYMKRQNTFRLISVSILGMFSQLLTIFIFGLAGLIYFNLKYPGTWGNAILAACIGVLILLAIFYYNFEKWLPRLQKIQLLRKYHIYGQLIMRFTLREQMLILGISMLRFCIYTAQYLVLLRWMNVQVPLPQAFFIASLFFWLIAVIPSITLAELGIRSQVSVYLFSKVSANVLGIIAASVGLWLINLIVPAVIGSVLLLRLRLFR